MLNHLVIVVCLLPLTVFSALINNTCSCSNQGKCITNPLGVEYCQCPPKFIDSNCQQEATNLALLTSPANITTHNTYFFIEFKTSTLYYVEIFFCPIDADPNSIFQIQIQFQDDNGSLTTINNTEAKLMQPHGEQCAVAKYVVMPFQRKLNGELIRLVVQMRKKEMKLGNNNNTLAWVEFKDQFKIGYTAYEFYKLSGEGIGQFMIISTLTSTLLICLMFIICRKIVARRRIRRFVYQPAHAVRDISAFDDLMPVVFYQDAPHLREEDKECMICLLSVEGTFTRTTPCRHLFHKECIDQWGRKSPTCPTCRNPLSPDASLQ